MSTVEIIVSSIQYYGLVGAGTAGLFLFIGIDRIDQNASNAYAFRPLLVPGAVLLWPLVLWRWWELERVRKNTCSSDARSLDREGM